MKFKKTLSLLLSSIVFCSALFAINVSGAKEVHAATVRGDVSVGEVYCTYIPVVKYANFAIIGERKCVGYIDGVAYDIYVPEIVRYSNLTGSGRMVYFTQPIRTSFLYTIAGKTRIVNVMVQPIDLSKY